MNAGHYSEIELSGLLLCEYLSTRIVCILYYYLAPQGEDVIHNLDQGESGSDHDATERLVDLAQYERATKYLKSGS